MAKHSDLKTVLTSLKKKMIGHKWEAIVDCKNQDDVAFEIVKDSGKVGVADIAAIISMLAINLEIKIEESDIKSPELKRRIHIVARDMMTAWDDIEKSLASRLN
jgi:uncharacterized protein (DUF111 family)